MVGNGRITQDDMVEETRSSKGEDAYIMLVKVSELAHESRLCICLLHKHAERRSESDSSANVLVCRIVTSSQAGSSE